MKTTFQQWLADYFGNPDFTAVPLAGDASFRLYYRIHHANQTLIAMDASAERERCLQFIAIANALRAKGLNTPEVFTSDLNAGYLLLTDFGDGLYVNELTHQNADELYSRALDSLATLSTCQRIDNYQVPIFTARFMRDELSLFQEWFIEKYLQITLTNEQLKSLAHCYDLIVDHCAQQPQVFMHRDYHSANLMVLPRDQVGILDFQDAFIGPVTYDLVSLLRDCYIDWPNELVEKWVRYYQQLIGSFVDPEEFISWFDWMSMQRHLKALLTFSRKYCRDKNANYLRFIPRTVNYVVTVSARYPELNALQEFFSEQVVEKIICVP